MRGTFRLTHHNNNSGSTLQITYYKKSSNIIYDKTHDIFVFSGFQEKWDKGSEYIKYQLIDTFKISGFEVIGCCSNDSGNTNVNVSFHSGLYWSQATLVRNFCLPSAFSQVTNTLGSGMSTKIIPSWWTIMSYQEKYRWLRILHSVDQMRTGHTGIRTRTAERDLKNARNK